MIGIVICLFVMGSYFFVLIIFFLFVVCILYGVGFGIIMIIYGIVVFDLIFLVCCGEGMGYFGFFGIFVMVFGLFIGLWFM